MILAFVNPNRFIIKIYSITNLMVLFCIMNVSILLQLWSKFKIFNSSKCENCIFLVDGGSSIDIYGFKLIYYENTFRN
jgi:hypothetical protein